MLVEGAPGADQFIDIGSEWRQLVDYVVTDMSFSMWVGLYDHSYHPPYNVKTLILLRVSNVIVLFAIFQLVGISPCNLCSGCVLHNKKLNINDKYIMVNVRSLKNVDE